MGHDINTTFSELFDLSKAINTWGNEEDSNYHSRIPSIKEHYSTFFKKRPYFVCNFCLRSVQSHASDELKY
jgi:hypothetical protein